MELPPQGVAKDLTPGFRPLHLGWGPNPKGKGGERSRGQERGKRLAERRPSRADPGPSRGQRLSVPGRGGNLRSCSPFGGGTVQGE